MKIAFLGLGSNTDAERNIASAVNQLRESFLRVVLSPIYRSRAVGFEGDDFINLVVRVETAMDPRQLQDYLRDLEDRHGRRRDVPKFSDRTLDIDILLYGDAVIEEEELTLPRPEILRFAHVLKPLADLAPDLEHPTEGRTIAELWENSECRDVELEPVDVGILETGEDDHSTTP